MGRGFHDIHARFYGFAIFIVLRLGCRGMMRGQSAGRAGWGRFLAPLTAMSNWIVHRCRWALFELGVSDADGRTPSFAAKGFFFDAGHDLLANFNREC